MASRIRRYFNESRGGIVAPVAAGTLADQIRSFSSGATILLVYTLTARATTATIADGTAAKGLADGQATVQLLGVEISVADSIFNAVGAEAFGTPIYWDAGNNRFTITAAGNTHVGWYVGLTALVAGTNANREIALKAS
jgi:hypothetical protein